MNPFFSIIIPIHNVAPFLRDCLDSVLAQTFCDWECICVDDGSSDGSSTLVDNYVLEAGADLSKKFKVVHIKNGGVSVARNKGMALAEGEWLCFLDGDDVVLPNWLATGHALYQETNADAICCNFTFWHPAKGLPINVRMDDYKISILKGTDIIHEWVWREVVRKGVGSSRLFLRKSIIQNHSLRFPEGMRMKEDRVFNLSALQNCGSIAITDYSGYLYRRHLGSACHHHRQVMDFLAFTQAIIKIWSQVSRNYNDELSRICLEEASRSVSEDFVELVEFGDQSRRHEFKLIKSVCADYINQNWLVSKWLYWRWKVPLCFFKVTQSFVLFYIVKDFLEIYRKVRGSAHQ